LCANKQTQRYPSEIPWWEKNKIIKNRLGLEIILAGIILTRFA